MIQVILLLIVMLIITTNVTINYYVVLVQGHSVQQTIESTVALAEVKWLEQEQVKISRAVDTAVQAAKSSWAHDKQREIGESFTWLCISHPFVYNYCSLCQHVLCLTPVNNGRLTRTRN